MPDARSPKGGDLTHDQVTKDEDYFAITYHSGTF